MSSFTLETTLDTKEPDVIELLGSPSATVQHQISGTLRLNVQKAIQFKQLSVTLVGEAYVHYHTAVVTVKSDAVNICRAECNAIDTPTVYQPGEHLLPFTLSIPGDLAATDPSKLKSDTLLWDYELISCGVPAGLFVRRKVIRQTITLKRLHVPPSETASVRYGAKRRDEIECSMFAPKFLSTLDTKVPLSVYLHPYSNAYRVKEILATAIQTEKITFDSKTIDGSLNGLRSMIPNSQDRDPLAPERYRNTSGPLVNTDNARIISQTLTIPNPDQAEFTTAWGREQAIDFELDLITSDMIPSESLEWLKVSHGVRFTVVFADPAIRNLVVIAPFQLGNVLQELWSLQGAAAPDGLTPPDYGVDDDHSTLLDSNTSRMARQQLHHETYPEREPIVVPDLANYDLPPVYEHEEERPQPYSEK
ncbi:hypothetical protein BGX28_008125 [Mortierella sp. GBA30]|nr:hypothetical protein BGX28_008125 [Mortierella sp. GBA30]